MKFNYFQTVLNIGIILIIIFIIVWCIYRFKYIERFSLEKECKPDAMVDKLKETVDKFLTEHKGKFTGLLKSLNNSTNMLSTLTICRADDASYTIDKEHTYLCVVDKKNGKYYDESFLMYVLLHELSHVICPEIGHTKLFDNIFTELLNEAEKCGIYEAAKTTMIGDYCGLTSEDTYTIDEFKVKKFV